MCPSSLATYESSLMETPCLVSKKMHANSRSAMENRSITIVTSIYRMERVLKRIPLQENLDSLHITLTMYVKYLVIDTNYVLNKINDIHPEHIYTTPDVIEEIKDEQS